MTDTEFVPKPQVREWDDQVRQMVETAETRLDTRIDVIEGRLSRLEYDKVHYEGRIDGRMTQMTEQITASNDRLQMLIEGFINKVSPVWDDLFGNPEDRKNNVDAIKSTATKNKKWGDYKDVGIKAIIAVVAVAVASIAWEATKRAFRDTPTATAAVIVPSQSTTVNTPAPHP